METGMNSSPEGVEPLQGSIFIAFPYCWFSFGDFQFIDGYSNSILLGHYFEFQLING